MPCPQDRPRHLSSRHPALLPCCMPYPRTQSFLARATLPFPCTPGAYLLQQLQHPGPTMPPPGLLPFHPQHLLFVPTLGATTTRPLHTAVLALLLPRCPFLPPARPPAAQHRADPVHPACLAANPHPTPRLLFPHPRRVLLQHGGRQRAGVRLHHPHPRVAELVGNHHRLRGAGAGRTTVPVMAQSNLQ